MKQRFFSPLCVLVLLLSFSLASASNSAEKKETAGVAAGAAPGRIVGPATDEMKALHANAWRYRAATYELYYGDSQELARTVYGIALHAGDIDASLSPERFIKGARGYHYSVGQMCDWINDLIRKKEAEPRFDELVLLGLLLQDRVVTVREGRFVPTGTIKHVLGAAPGAKRSFADNLRHERLHIFWDENADMRRQTEKKWQALSAAEKDKARKALAQYAQGNEEQLIEEWAIYNAEQSNRDLQ